MKSMIWSVAFGTVFHQVASFSLDTAIHLKFFPSCDVPVFRFKCAVLPPVNATLGSPNNSQISFIHNTIISFPTFDSPS